MILSTQKFPMKNTWKVGKELGLILQAWNFLGGPQKEIWNVRERMPETVERVHSYNSPSSLRHKITSTYG